MKLPEVSPLFHSFWREKPRRAGIHRQLKRLLVRIAEHEHLAAALILTDDRDERRFHEKLA